MECVHEIQVDTHTDITPLRPVEGITLPGVSSFLPPGSWLREGWQETLEGNESSLYLQMVPFFPVSIMYWVPGNKTLTPSLSASWSSHMPAATMGTRGQRYITHGLGDTPGEISASKGHHMDARFKSTKSKKKKKKVPNPRTDKQLEHTLLKGVVRDGGLTPAHQTCLQSQKLLDWVQKSPGPTKTRPQRAQRFKYQPDHRQEQKQNEKNRGTRRLSPRYNPAHWKENLFLTTWTNVI